MATAGANKAVNRTKFFIIDHLICVEAAVIKHYTAAML